MVSYRACQIRYNENLDLRNSTPLTQIVHYNEILGVKKVKPSYKFVKTLTISIKGHGSECGMVLHTIP